MVCASQIGALPDPLAERQAPQGSCYLRSYSGKVADSSDSETRAEFKVHVGSKLEIRVDLDARTARFVVDGEEHPYVARGITAPVHGFVYSYRGSGPVAARLTAVSGALSPLHLAPDPTGAPLVDEALLAAARAKVGSVQHAVALKALEKALAASNAAASGARVSVPISARIALDIGSRVRVRRSLQSPTYGWGDGVTHSSIGVIRAIVDRDAHVIFPEQDDCLCALSDLEAISRPATLLLPDLIKAIDSAKAGGVDTALAESRLAELQELEARREVAHLACEDAKTAEELEAALKQAAGTCLVDDAVAAARQKLQAAIAMKMELAANASSMVAALEIAKRCAQLFEGTSEMKALEALLSRSRASLKELSQEDDRRAEREANGVPDIEMPPEYLCPITYEAMVCCQHSPTHRTLAHTHSWEFAAHPSYP